MSQRGEADLLSSRYIYLLAFAGIVVYWIADAWMDIAFFGHETWRELLLQPSAEELYERLLVILLLLLAGFLWDTFRRRTRRTDHVLAGSEARYRAVVDTYPEYLIVHDRDRILFSNRRTLELFGLSDAKDLSRYGFLDFIHADYRDLILAGNESVSTSGQPTKAQEIRIQLPGNRSLDVVLTTTRIEFEGQPALLTFFRDISEHIETRRDLLASRERLRLALEAAQDGVWDWDLPTGRMIYNQAWANMLGYDLAEISQDRSTWLSVVHPDDHKRVEETVRGHLDGESAHFETEVRLRHKKGHYIWVLDRGKVVDRDENGDPLRMAGTHRDITARKKAELALEIRNRIAEVFLTGSGAEVYPGILRLVCETASSPRGMFGVLDSAGNVEIRALLGGSDTQQQGVSYLRRLPATNLPPLLSQVIDDVQAVVVNEPGRGAGPLQSDTLLAVPIITRDQVLGVIVVAGRKQPYGDADRSLLESLSGYLAPILQSHMTSEAKEDQLRQAQKMEALGALAGGIAHDFNNILQAIMGFTTLVRDDLQRDSTGARDLERVLRATHRGKELVERILLFSRREEQDRQSIDVKTIVTEAVGLLRPSIPATIEVQTAIEPDCGRILGDPSQISQVVMNLATNAYHAMEADGGLLRIELRCHTGMEPAADLPDGLLDRPLIVLTVIDTGCGIAPDVVDRIFDPFFTTKEVGKGTGLGLSVVHGIVVGHGGDIRIESQPGQGTMVQVFLPKLEAPLVEPASDQPAAKAVDRSGRILFVDDEEDIAAMGKAFLEKLGFAVTAETDGRAALKALRDPDENYDLLITDLTMPHITGLQLAEEAAIARKDLPVVLISGFGDKTDDVVKSHPYIWGVINKPFGGDTLRRTVCQALKLPAEQGDDA